MYQIYYYYKQLLIYRPAQLVITERKCCHTGNLLPENFVFTIYFHCRLLLTQAKLASVATDCIFEAVLSSEGKFLPRYLLCSDYPGVTWLPALAVKFMEMVQNHTGPIPLPHS